MTNLALCEVGPNLVSLVQNALAGLALFVVTMTILLSTYKLSYYKIQKGVTDE